jgi:hypothetical protein
MRRLTRLSRVGHKGELSRWEASGVVCGRIIMGGEQERGAKRRVPAGERQVGGSAAFSVTEKGTTLADVQK